VLELGRGERGAAATAAEGALAHAAHAPLGERLRAVAVAAPVLSDCGHPARASAVVDEALAACVPGVSHARLLAVRAWLALAGGREEAALADLAAAWEAAGARGIVHLIRLEWPRIRELLWLALERGKLPPQECLEAVQASGRDGDDLVRCASHARPEVRRAVIAPLAASGHPRSVPMLEALATDSDGGVALAAQRALERVRADPLPLRLRVLGGFVARRGDWTIEPSAWGRPMAARLVRCLLTRDGAVMHEEELLEQLWPSLEPASARRSLHVAVHRARAALDVRGAARSVLEINGEGYRLRLGAQDTFDAAEFDAAAQIALGVAGSDRRAQLEQACALWRGEPLPDDRYEPWAIAWCERLVERYVAVLAGLVEVCLQSGDVAAAIDSAHRLTAIDRFNEGAHRDLMIAYARAGRTGHALRQYLTCRRTLVAELGVEPAEATRRLHGRILAGKPV
jgi:DNA-binding SARP family transcriptional activator